jgi:hypothetical protein
MSHNDSAHGLKELRANIHMGMHQDGTAVHESNTSLTTSVHRMQPQTYRTESDTRSSSYNTSTPALDLVKLPALT